MEEYIVRDEVVRELERRERAGDEIFSIRAMKHYIKTRLSADVAPVVHGRWIFGKDLPYNWGNHFKNKYHIYCSECLEQAFNSSEDNDYDFDVVTMYCPNCGAKMDLRE